MEYYVTTKKDESGLYVLTLKELHMDLWTPIKMICTPLYHLHKKHVHNTVNAVNRYLLQIHAKMQNKSTDIDL